jgi:hypothetical protein
MSNKFNLNRFESMNDEENDDFTVENQNRKRQKRKKEKKKCLPNQCAAMAQNVFRYRRKCSVDDVVFTIGCFQKL